MKTFTKKCTVNSIFFYRVAIMRMKADPKASELKFAKKAASMWMSKTAGKKEVVDPRGSHATNEV